MRLRCVAVVAAAALQVSSPTLSHAAQQPVRVLRHAPVDTARPGDVITVSFDRPVAGSLERTPDLSRIVRIEPTLDGQLQWRDPATIRIVPREPLTPGRHYRITVANDFAAVDGGRLDAPYVFTIRTRGPGILASIPTLGPQHAQTMEPNGTIRLVYSAPVDSAQFASVVRLEIARSPECVARSIRYTVHSQRPITDTDDWNVLYAGGFNRDSLEQQFRRLVEIRPVARLPEECRGEIILPSLDPTDRAEIRYPISTAPRFTVSGLDCHRNDCAAENDLSIMLSAPVSRDALLARLHVEPNVRFTIAPSEPASSSWKIQLPVRPRTTYRVRVDSSLRDIYGRRITGNRTATLTVGDRLPTLGHQLGFFAVSRARPAIRLTHVNVDSVSMVIVPIPDSLRVLILGLENDQDSVARTVARLKDVVVRRIRLRAELNVEHISEIPIPTTLLGARTAQTHTPLLAIRVRPFTRTALDTVGRTADGAPILASPPGTGMVPTRRVAIVQVTNLVAHAKVSDIWGSVFVTDATTGRPVQGARVTTRDSADRIMSSGNTDASGVAQLDPVAGRPRPVRDRPASGWRYGYPNDGAEARLAEVVHGADRSLVPLTDDSWSRLDAVNRLGGQVDPVRLVRASAFTDRAIYRPGEMVYVTSIIRVGALAALRVPTTGDSVRLVVKRPDYGDGTEHVIRNSILRLGAYGTVADSFSLSAAATLGTYQVDIETFDGGREMAGQAAFTVAEYRTPEFETKVVVDSGITFRGDVVRANASSRYYFGAPMRGAVVRWSAITSEVRGVGVPGLPAGYMVGRGHAGVSEPHGASTNTTGVDTLDADGRATIRVPTSAAPSAYPASLSISVAVADVNRQVVGGSHWTMLHSSSFYIAARDSGTGSWYWKENVPRAIGLLTVRPDGRRVSNVPVTVTVLRHHMKLTLGDDTRSPTTTWVTDTVLRDSVRTRDTGTPYTYTPRSTGWHELIFTSVDERGRPMITSFGGYVIGRQPVPWDENPLRVAMQVDNEEVNVGDSVAVRFVSPFARAEAWVTVERDAVLAQRRLQVAAGETVVRFPVTEAFFPAAQVSVVLVDSGSSWASDSMHLRMRAGYANLRVPRTVRELHVDVRPAERVYAPGDSARITVAVRDQASQPVQAQITLWAVDEGVLALAYFGRPNPIASLYAMYGTGLMFTSSTSSMAMRRRFLPAQLGWEVSADLVEARMLGLSANVQGSGSGAAGGFAKGSAGDASSPVRSNFRTTAFYIASLVTDAAGTATATVKLPDNVTTYRLIAVAVTAGDAYGSAESTMRLTKPLLARAALPRFVREGDTIVAGAVVNNNTPAALSARIGASGTGLRPVGDTTTTRSLGQGGATEVRFSWRTTARAGDSAVVRFSVSGDTHSDVVRTSLPVRAPYAPRYHVVSGVAADAATIRMMLPPDIDPVRSRLTLRVGTSPVPIIRAAYGQLEVYPYLCTEQLTSNGRVILSMLRLQRAGVVDSTVAPSASTLRGRLQYVADEIARRQSRFGSIGYWSGSTWTSGWLSAYAGELLIDARAANITVDSTVIAGIVRFVAPEPDTVSRVREEAYGTRVERQRAGQWRRSQELAALHFLRRAGVPDVAQEDRLVADAAGMVWEDRVWLVDLLAQRRDQSVARAHLARVWRDVEVAGTRVDVPDSLLQTLGFPSHVRPVARLLHATLAVDPDHPRLSALIERVVQQGRAQRQTMWNTQDYASVAEALTTLAIADRQAGPVAGITVRSARAGANDRVLLARSGPGRDETAISLDGLLERDGEWMALPARISSTGGRVFYVLTVDEVPMTPPTTPDAKGIIVERWFERFDDGRPVTEVTEGDLVRGQLRITVPADREFVAVEDLLPAGLEIVDMSLRTSTLGPFESEQSREAARAGNRANPSRAATPWLYGTWAGGWWSPWEHTEMRDDRAMYFARVLWKGSYTASYVARATTAGTFVRPPAHAEEMYNPSLGGRSEGGTFRVLPRQ